MPNATLREIGAALGVAHVLEGTVQRAGGRVRVSAQLIDARTDSQLWAERYDRDVADVFAIESELAGKIVAQLQAKTLVPARKRPSSKNQRLILQLTICTYGPKRSSTTSAFQYASSTRAYRRPFAC